MAAGAAATVKEERDMQTVVHRTREHAFDWTDTSRALDSTTTIRRSSYLLLMRVCA